MVAYTMESVCILFGAKPNWKESKNLMSKMTFMDELKSFDKDNIPPKIIRALKSYIENPGFLPEEVAKVSVCASFRLLWSTPTTCKNLGSNGEDHRQAQAAPGIRGSICVGVLPTFGR